MKATGVVRRIDDLGRVVIPKEIRKTLRIKEGDPLEIFTDKEGEVILKKYSPIGELSEFALGYAETLAKTTGHIACITDKDTVIAVAGGSKKDYLEQSLSKEIEQIMEDKEVYKSDKNNNLSVPIVKNDTHSSDDTAKFTKHDLFSLLIDLLYFKSLYGVRFRIFYGDAFFRFGILNNEIINLVQSYYSKDLACQLGIIFKYERERL